VSVYGPLLLHFRPPQLLIFNFDADPDPAFEFFVDLFVTFKMPTINSTVFFDTYSYYFLKVHLHHSSKIKNHKEVKKQISRFFLLLCLMIKKSGFSSLPLTNRSRSRRAKNLRIRNTSSDIGIGSQTLITRV
jgi:hypothetical protein